MTDNLPAHSSIMGGSTAAQRIYCPGSYKLEKKMPKSGDSTYAKEGTALHHAMEHILLELEPGASATELLGMVFNDTVITHDHIDNKIEPALDAFREICAKYGELDYLIEFKGSLDKVIPGAFGTVDLLGKFKNGPILNLDWKFGDGVPVSVEGNMQLGFYAGCALYSEDPEIIDMLGSTEAVTIIFAIVQPRRGVEGPCYELWETTDEWVEDFLDLALEGYNQAISDDAPIKAGSHCRWCDAKPICPAKQAIIGEAESTRPESMDATSLAKLMDKADELEDWVKSVRKLLRTELDNGATVPGWKLVPKRASRVYTDQVKAQGVLVRQLKTEAAHKPREIISPAQAEKKLGKQKYSKLLSKYVTLVSSGDTLAKDDDPRPDAGDAVTQLGNLSDGLNAAGGLFDK